MADADPYAAILQTYTSGKPATDQPPPTLGDIQQGAQTDPYAGLLTASSGAQPAPGQMGGWQREVALPASNVAKGLVSVVGLPGDVVRGVGYVSGQRAQQYLDPDPITAARNQVMLSPTQGPQILTPEMLAASVGKPNVLAPSFHNPIDTESLLSLPGVRDVANRPDLQPQNLRERIEAAGAQGIGGAIPMLFTGGASGAAGVLRTLAQGAAGGVGSEVGGTAGEAVAGPTGRVVGGLGGALVGGRMAPGGGGVGSFVPRGMDAETTALAQRAQDLGIKVSLGAASETPWVTYADSMARKVPLSGYTSYDKTNQTAVNRATAATFGETADKITPDTINSAYERLGPVFNDAAGRYNLRFDPSMDRELSDISRRVREAAIDEGQKSGIQTQIDKIRQLAADNNGVIPGNAYVDLTKKGESLDLLQGSRSTVSGQLGGQIRDALDGALERSAAPKDVAALREARTQYKALKTVEPLTLAADNKEGGVTPSTGDISGPALLNRVRQQYDGAARANLGDIPLLDIARVSQRFLKEPRSSGTGERMTLGDLGKSIAGAASPIVGAHYAGYGPEQSIPALAAALTLPYAAGSIWRSPAILPRQPLINALAGGLPMLTGPHKPNE